MKLIFQSRKLKQLQQLPGNTGFRESKLLFQIARSLKNNAVIVEIGSFLGKTTCFIAEGIGNKQIQFLTVDTWNNDKKPGGHKDVYDEYLENTKAYKGKFTPLRGYSYDIVKTWPQQRKINFLFIDGDHSYEGMKRDIEDWLPLVKDKGIVCFHDYRDAPGVIKAVDEARKQGRLKFIRQVTSIYMAQYIRKGRSS
ncbi:class I SAM-dependent methyltransferase [Candidatus Omnitrophota bacterium]